MKKSEVWGVRYVEPGESATLHPGESDRYAYVAYVRSGPVKLSHSESGYAIKVDGHNATALALEPGETVPAGEAELVVAIPGPRFETQIRNVTRSTYLPYVNGCSTKQLFPPERAGDPTFQYLDIPPFSKEQAHHIHSTARVVYILDGEGTSVVGMEGKVEETRLVAGMVCVLDPMCPHHFETPQGKHLICLPVHVWSSTGPGEFNHPMFNGTHLMNQGG